MEEILTYMAVGFFAQMIDGTLGMAYGVSATTFMLSLGIAPAVASASVHAAECITTGISGFSHFKLGNVNKPLFKRLIIPGVLGAVIGGYILVSIPGDIIKPFIAGYLLLMGILILSKAFRNFVPKEVKTYLIPLGFVGGFLDAIGGGGWGPVVVSTLVARGNHPRFTIGSVNLAEFFVALSASMTFILTIGLQLWQAIVGLAIGGSIAAPLAAFACKKAPTKALLIMVGILIIILSIRTIYLTF